MAYGVFHHKPDSQYDDQPDRHYHFPSRYLARVKEFVGDRIIYYGPLENRNGRFYWATAKVTKIRADEARPDHYYADLADYIDFDEPVYYLQNGGFERKLVRSDGTINGGRAVNAVRNLDPKEYGAIIDAGLSTRDEWPDRDESQIISEDPGGFHDPSVPFERPIVQQLVNRPFRENKFRQHIRKIYDRTCSFSGLRLINGAGRPEVEAAHIRPVEAGGSDSVRNGIALSATLHWMFDRGLLSLADDHTILLSRHLNYDVSHILNRDLKARVPTPPSLQPHPIYLRWHREKVFKT
jgi:putative restriction endonuclease